MRVKQKSILFGVLAGFGLLAFYLSVMLLTMPTLREAGNSLRETWYFILILVAGFGFQIGFWVFLKNCGQGRGSGAMPGVSGTFSGGAMLACCAHHLADLLPIIGLSGAAVFLSQYQRPFLILGLSVNLSGLAYMLNLYRRHSMASRQKGGDHHGQS